MSNKRKINAALFPAQTEFPESRKMSDTSSDNAAIVDFFTFLLERGYVLARRDPESGALRAMKTDQTVMHELYVFRGVDKVAIRLERDRMRVMYPHLWTRYGLTDDDLNDDPVPQYADSPVTCRPDMPPHDDEVMSLAEAWRRGVFTLTPSHSGVRVKLTRTRHNYPHLMPKMTPKGSLTLYRVGDLREWELRYTEEAGDTQARVLLAGDPSKLESASVPVTADQPRLEPVEVVDALEFLMSKIRGEGE